MNMMNRVLHYYYVQSHVLASLLVHIHLSTCINKGLILQYHMFVLKIVVRLH